MEMKFKLNIRGRKKMGKILVKKEEKQKFLRDGEMQDFIIYS
jgi:hypothetical protein